MISSSVVKCLFLTSGDGNIVYQKQYLSALLRLSNTADTAALRSISSLVVYRAIIKGNELFWFRDVVLVLEVFGMREGRM